MSVEPRVNSVEIMRIIQIFSQNNVCRPDVFKEGLSEMQSKGNTTKLKNTLLSIRVPANLSSYVKEALELL